MNFLFVYVGMSTGGIETLILRMTDWLIQNNHNVDILLMKRDGELLKKINKEANIFDLGGGYPELKLLSGYLKNGFSDKYEVIYSFCPVTTWMALLLGEKSQKNPIVFNGVYHTFDYKLFGNSYTRKVFDRGLPDRCKIFMTPVVKAEHERIINRKMDSSMIWPIAIDSSKFSNIIRKARKFKIVSIGRLTSFKTYNLTMLDVVKKLLRENYDVEYYICGNGELAGAVADRIKELELSEHVYLCGTLDYDKITEMLSDAFLFVGMGTSVIEAGFCKVPSLVAIAYAEKPITHGYIHELPDLNCGEFNETYATYDLYDQIKVLFESSEAEYENICNTMLEVLKNQYDIEILMKKLLDEIGNIKQEQVAFTKIATPYYFIFTQTISNMKVNLKSWLKKIKGKIFGLHPVPSA